MRVVPVVMLLVLGCGAEILDGAEVADDGKGDDPGGGGEPAPEALGPDDFLEQVGVIECDHAFACRAEFPAAEFGISFEEFVGGDTPEDCYEATEAVFQPELVAASVAAGRIAYAEPAAAACLDGISFPATCDDYWLEGPSFPEICGVSLIGTVPDGGACTLDIDCLGVDSFCTQGTCAP